MSISTPPPPAPPKKSGLGCFGCGCLVLALLAILLIALLAGGSYLGYAKILSLTSSQPAEIPRFSGDDDIYNHAQQKFHDFGHDVENHQAATIQLSADEINSLIAHNPTFIQQKVHLFVSLSNDQAEVKGSVPTAVFVRSLFTGRYINFDTTFGIGFNSGAKSIDLFLHHLKIGDQPAPENLLPTLQAEFTPLINAELQQNADTKKLLQQAKSIQIKDGELMIETQ